MKRRNTFYLLLLLAQAACSEKQLQEESSQKKLVFQEVEVPAEVGSRYSNLAVTDDKVYLSWLQHASEPAVLLSKYEQDSWSVPDTVAIGAEVLENFADFPSIALLQNDSLAVHYLSLTSPDLFAYDLSLRIGQPGEWSEEMKPHTDSTETEHGFVSMFPLQEATGIVWLDGRNYAGASDAHAQDAGPMTLRFSKLQNGKLSPSVLLDERVCDCCQTDAAATEKGALLVYRNRTEEEIRDIAILKYADGQWSSPKILANDSWQVHGCPVNGPAIATHAKHAVAAWFTAAEGTAKVQLSISSDEGESWSAPVLVDSTGALGRVDVAWLRDNNFVVSWVDGEADPAQIKMARFSADGKKLSEQAVATISGNRTSGFPRMAVNEQELWLTYTAQEKGEKQAKLLKASLQ